MILVHSQLSIQEVTTFMAIFALFPSTVLTPAEAPH